MTRMAGSGGDLVVRLHDRRIGKLRRVPNGARFAYDAEIQNTMAGVPLLSVGMPVRDREYDAATTGCWFRGLLPEDERVDEVRSLFGIEGTSYLDVLEQIGWECAGAVSVTPEDMLWPIAGDAESARASEPLSSEELARRLTALPRHPFDTEATLRISLSGFQSKMCVIGPIIPHEMTPTIEAGSFSLPLNGLPSTHILKPEPRRFPGLAEGEAWAMRVAAHVTPAARVALLKLDGAPPTLCVERFDRVLDGEGTPVRRIHQEDCAQALGVDVDRKYATQGSPKKSDPSFRRIAMLFDTYCEDSHEQLLRLFDQMVVNVVLGNTDAHAKNYSIMHPRPGWIALSPLYDVVPAAEITPGVRHMGMRIANQLSIDKVERKHLLAETNGWGLSEGALEERLDRDLELLVEGMSLESVYFPRAAARHERPAIARAKRLMRDAGTA